ncbi:MAG: aminodeoxychorismate synthase component I [Alphaproteobacteria bacterium]|nr:aminodeoxychorismate synthase component I [Alphaproteobacteria bacterium]MCD8571163.1 aminodeoxychorismate synthase component I [Alphaproteobacteria bacterium]
MHHTPESIARAWQHQPHLLWLDSADTRHPDAGWSYVMADPAEWIEGEMAKCLPHIRAALANHKITASTPAPFQGGAAGMFSYDGDVAIGIYTQIFAYNHAEEKGYFIGCEAPQGETQEPPRDETALSWQPTITAAAYQARAQKVIDYIKAGDIFQANLSQVFTAELPENFAPLDHYLRLRTANPAPFGGYFDTGHLQISSCSPERFLKLYDTGRIETKPIKGTSPRSPHSVQDKISAESLLASMKDRAENIMIVDLLRNDLSKVSETSSVQVEKLCALESFAKVHHLVSTISGQLEPGKDALDLLAACFPGGSITGAPKIRAMEIIAELEDTKRGPYTGALGWIGFDGAMDTNILIRSIIYENGTARLNVGGGITARSEPKAEYEETLAKAGGMQR